MSILLLPERFDERAQYFKIMEAEFVFALVLKASALENLQTGLIRKAILFLVTSVLKQRLQKFYLYCQKKKFSALRSIGLRTTVNAGSTNGHEQCFPPSLSFSSIGTATLVGFGLLNYR